MAERIQWHDSIYVNTLVHGGWVLLLMLVFAFSRSVTFGQQPSSTPHVEQRVQVEQIAPDFQAPQTSLPDLSRVGVEADRQQPLSLREAIALALENNKDIEVARQNVRIAEFDLTGARGAYDPRITSASYFERINTPVSSFLAGGSNGVTTVSDYTSTVRFEGEATRFGGNYRLDFSSIRQTTNNQFTALTPQFPTSLTFSYTQPLLRGLSFDNRRRQIEIAKKNLTLTDAQFRERAIETITNVQRVYWDLVFALRNLQIQRDAVRDSRQQMEHNKRLVAEGNLAPIDIVAAEAQVAGFEQELFAAVEEVSRTENRLKQLIAGDTNADVWSRSLIPTDQVELVAAAVSLNDAMKAAVENRPELQQSNVIAEINKIDQQYFREQTKPALDLIASYGVVGLAGSVNSGATNPFLSTTVLRDRLNELSVLAGLSALPIPPATTLPQDLIGGYGQSLQNLFGNQFNNYRVGVQLSLPLRNRTAEAQLGRSLVEGERIIAQRAQLEQSIKVEVRNALQALLSAQARLRAAGVARTAGEQQYESEKRKLDAGQSTVFLVLERQTALTTAKGNELRAQTELNKATAELQRAMGSVLIVNSIVVRAR